jgi:RnfABCDGE-type electron transport complex B subunit
MSTIVIAVSSVTVIGALCAALLAVASKIMHVAVDERVERISGALPGSNCGACGFPGCSGFAAAIVKDASVKYNLCTPGGAAVVAAIGDIMGVAGEAAVSKVAVVRCCGDEESRKVKMEYAGIKTCYAAKNGVFAGEAACAYGCFGYGDCKAVCPVGAICIDKGLARVNISLCNGCGMCVKACANGIISMEHGAVRTLVACSNVEKAVAARRKCANACLGCGRCAKECPQTAIEMENNLAHINYEKCDDCGHCVGICPTKCIKGFTR